METRNEYTYILVNWQQKQCNEAKKVSSVNGAGTSQHPQQQRNEVRYWS